MAAKPAPTPGQQLEQLAAELHSLAIDMDYGTPGVLQSERRIDRAERIASDVRAVVRGRRCPDADAGLDRVLVRG